MAGLDYRCGGWPPGPWLERVLVPKPRQLHRLIASHRIYVDWPQELLMPMGICYLLPVGFDVAGIRAAVGER